MPALIRLSRPSDIEALASLVGLYWDFEKLPGFDRLRTLTLLAELLAHPHRGHCWVAETDGGLVGYLLAVYVFSLEHGGLMAEIDELFVVPENRRSKIGEALLREASQAMATQGMTQLQLQLGINNAHGRHFYERHAFRPLPGYTLWQKTLAIVDPRSNE